MNPDENKKSITEDAYPQTHNVFCGRESAQAMLGNLIERKSRRTAALRCLMNVIPWHLLSKDQEDLLWSYFAHGGAKKGY